MNKKEFYDVLIQDLDRRSKIKGTFLRNDMDSRGNIAVFCEITDKAEYGYIVDKLSKQTDSDFCWMIYHTIHEWVLPELRTEKEQKLDYAVFNMTELFYEMGRLSNLTCVEADKFPDWFFILEKLRKLREG